MTVFLYMKPAASLGPPSVISRIESYPKIRQLGEKGTKQFWEGMMLNFEVRIGGTIELREGIPGNSRKEKRFERAEDTSGTNDGRNTSTLLILGARQI